MVNGLDHSLFHITQHGSEPCVLSNPVGLGDLQKGRVGKGEREKKKARGKGKNKISVIYRDFQGQIVSLSLGTMSEKSFLPFHASDTSLLLMTLVILILRVVSFFFFNLENI